MIGLKAPRALSFFYRKEVRQARSERSRPTKDFFLSLITLNKFFANVKTHDVTKSMVVHERYYCGDCLLLCVQLLLSIPRLQQQMEFIECQQDCQTLLYKLAGALTPEEAQQLSPATFEAIRSLVARAPAPAIAHSFCNSPLLLKTLTYGALAVRERSNITSSLHVVAIFLASSVEPTDSAYFPASWDPPTLSALKHASNVATGLCESYRDLCSQFFWTLVVASLLPPYRVEGVTHEVFTSHKVLRETIRKILRARLKHNIIAQPSGDVLFGFETAFSQLLKIPDLSNDNFIEALASRMFQLSYTTPAVIQDLFSHLPSMNPLTLQLVFGELLLHLCVLGATDLTVGEKGHFFRQRLVLPSLKFGVSVCLEQLSNNNPVSSVDAPLVLLRSVISVMSCYAVDLDPESELFEKGVRLHLAALHIPQAGDNIVSMNAKEDHLAAVGLLKLMTAAVQQKHTLPSPVCELIVTVIHSVLFKAPWYTVKECFHEPVPMSLKSYGLLYVCGGLALRRLEHCCPGQGSQHADRILSEFSTSLQRFLETSDMSKHLLLRYRVTTSCVDAFASSLIGDIHSFTLKHLGVRLPDHTSLRCNSTTLPCVILPRPAVLHLTQGFITTLSSLIPLVTADLCVDLGDCLDSIAACLGTLYRCGCPIVDDVLPLFQQCPLGKFWFHFFSLLCAPPILLQSNQISRRAVIWSALERYGQSAMAALCAADPVLQLRMMGPALEGVTQLILTEEKTFHDGKDAWPAALMHADIVCTFFVLTDLITASSAATNSLLPLQAVQLLTQSLAYATKHDALPSTVFLNFLREKLKPGVFAQLCRRSAEALTCTHLEFHIACLLIALRGCTSKDVSLKPLTDAIFWGLEASRKIDSVETVVPATLAAAERLHFGTWKTMKDPTRTHFVREMCHGLNKEEEAARRAQVRTVLKKFCYMKPSCT